MGEDKANKTPKDDQVKVTLDLKTTERVTPVWLRLWELLLSPRPKFRETRGVQDGKPTDFEPDGESERQGREV